jgi:UDP-galactopyranose mutase
VEYDVVCLSHLRWDFVFQRPQHLMTRCARRHGVFFVERPLFDTAEPRLDVYERDGVRVVVPHLPSGDDGRAAEVTGALVNDLLEREGSRPYVAWY